MGTDSALLLLLAEERGRRAEVEAEVERLRAELAELAGRSRPDLKET